MKLPVIAACLLLAMPTAFAQTAPATAPTDDATPAPAAQAEAAKPQKKKVCTRERPMGSNMSRKVCRNVDDLQAQSDDAREAMRDLMLRGPSQASGN